MDTDFRKDVEKLLAWLFDHDQEFIEKFIDDKTFNIDNAAISGYFIVVIDNNYRGEVARKFVDLVEVIEWIGEHKDGY